MICINIKLFAIVVIIAFFIGAIITYISGFFNTPINWVGAQIWGMPIYWKIKVLVEPGYQTSVQVLWDRILIDIIFWFII